MCFSCLITTVPVGCLSCGAVSLSPWQFLGSTVGRVQLKTPLPSIIPGGSRFYDNIAQMVGFRLNPWLRVCWTFLTPLVCASIFVFMWATFKPLVYNRVYVFPAWAQGLGLAMAFSSMICIPLTCLIKTIMTPGTLKEVRYVYLIQSLAI